MSGERKGGREAVDRLARRVRDSGVPADQARAKAVEAIKRLERRKKG